MSAATANVFLCQRVFFAASLLAFQVVAARFLSSIFDFESALFGSQIANDAF
jgi:hypothetical protein